MTEQEKQAIRERWVEADKENFASIYTVDLLKYDIPRLLTALDERDREVKDTYADYKEKDLQLRLEKAKNERLRKALENVRKTIADASGTYDKPKRISFDTCLEVYRIAGKALAGEEKG